MIFSILALFLYSLFIFPIHSERINVALFHVSAFSVQCSVDTCREANGEIAIGNKIWWAIKEPKGSKHLFTGKRIYTCLSTKAQITPLPTSFPYPTVTITLSCLDCFSVILLLPFHC